MRDSETETLLDDDYCGKISNDTSDSESIAFKNLYFPRIKNKLQKKIFREKSPVILTDDDMIGLYNLCASEISGFNTSRTCNIFSKYASDAIEYFYDLEKFYSDSYGNPSSVKLAIPLLKRMLERFTTVSQNPNYQLSKYDEELAELGEFYFASEGAITRFVTMLGIFILFYSLFFLMFNFLNDRIV